MCPQTDAPLSQPQSRRRCSAPLLRRSGHGSRQLLQASSGWATAPSAKSPLGARRSLRTRRPLGSWWATLRSTRTASALRPLSPSTPSSCGAPGGGSRTSCMLSTCGWATL
eukprot:Amastigsp_a841639_12.p5 type:complete len:111 gc:universal Amastigsp_a841639_12:670-338(-)